LEQENESSPLTQTDTIPDISAQETSATQTHHEHEYPHETLRTNRNLITEDPIHLKRLLRF
jgi:hypothetical protein